MALQLIRQAFQMKIMRKRMTIGIVLFLIMLGIAAGCNREEGYSETLQPTEFDIAGVSDESAGSEDITEASSQDDSRIISEKQENCVIFICGAVMMPGVYELPDGSRICDAIEASGGFTEAAAVNYLNQAQLLSDGIQIYVPTTEEVTEDLIPAEAGSVSESVIFGNSDGKININTAEKEELMQLSGIGEKKADSILAYRQEHGNFTSVDELMNVPGIKEGVFTKIREQITL